MYTTNEWYTTAKAIDKKICNKIIELANNNWQPEKLAVRVIINQILN